MNELKKNTATEPKESTPEMFPASTELTADQNSKLEAFRIKEGRTRANALRFIIGLWAATQPKA